VLSLPVAAGTLGISRRAYLYQPTLSEGDSTVTLTIPGAGLPWYHVNVMTSWQNSGWYLVSQSATQVVIGFSTPAGATPQVQVEIIY